MQKLSARSRRHHLEIQVDILAKELHLDFVPMELGPGGSSGRFETGVLHRISIPFIWAEWFGLNNLISGANLSIGLF